MNKYKKTLNIFILQNIYHIKSLVFVIGFIIDWLTLPKISSPFYTWIGPIYILLLVILFKFRNISDIFYNNFHNHSEIRLRKSNRFKEFLIQNYFLYIHKNITFFISFFLGSLLSYVLVYYFKSTEILISWPLIFIIILSILINEFFNKKISDLILFFIGTTFYFIFNIPIFYNKVDDISFILSMGVSILFALVFTRFISINNYKEKLIIYLFIFLFPLLLSIFYFTNNMPAVPLYLKDKGFYSFVKKDKNDYIKQEFYSDANYIYFYSSIVSPLEVNAKISHLWYKYNENIKEWQLINSINFPIYGGREDGYRGYTYIASKGKGEYKVIVKAGERVVGQKGIIVK